MASAPRFVALTRAKDDWYVELIGEPGEPRADVERRARAQLVATAAPARALADLQIMGYAAAVKAYLSAVRLYEAAREYSARRQGGEET